MFKKGLAKEILKFKRGWAEYNLDESIDAFLECYFKSKTMSL